MADDCPHQKGSSIVQYNSRKCDQSTQTTTAQVPSARIAYLLGQASGPQLNCALGTMPSDDNFFQNYYCIKCFEKKPIALNYHLDFKLFDCIRLYHSNGYFSECTLENITVAILEILFSRCIREIKKLIRKCILNFFKNIFLKNIIKNS